MNDEMVHSLKQRAFRELARRDDEGSFLKLDYEQTRAFNKRDVHIIRPIVDRELRRYKRMLWVMGPGVPILLAGWLYFNLFRPAESAGADVSIVDVGFATVWAVLSMAYALTMALPRIASMERACALLDALAERPSGTEESTTADTHLATRVSS